MGLLFSCIQVERPHKLNNRLKPVGPGSAGIQIQSLIATNAQNSFQVASPGANYIIEKIPGHHSQGFSGIKRDRKSVVEGKSGSVRLDTGGRRVIKKKNKNNKYNKKGK